MQPPIHLHRTHAHSRPCALRAQCQLDATEGECGKRDSTHRLLAAALACAAAACTCGTLLLGGVLYRRRRARAGLPRREASRQCQTPP